MNGSLDGSAQKGAIPKVKVASLAEQAPAGDNNNSRRSLYSDDENDHGGDDQRRSSPRPSTSVSVRPVTLNCASRWLKEEASSQHKGDMDSSECDTDLNVLPKQLMQDLCSLNGDCDICGRTGVDKYKMCHLNGDERTDGEDSDDEREDDDDEEGAVGGAEELLMEVLPIRSSPDSGEGELDTHKSRSPSCSWDQQSLSSGDECFYRYKGEDDEVQPPAPIVNLPAEQAERHRSSSPEMDYLEMDFDPSSDWGGDEAVPVEEQPVPELVLPPVFRPTPEPVVAPVLERNLSPSPAPISRPPLRTAGVENCGEVMIWSQSRAAELMQSSSTSLYAAANTIFYALNALSCQISRDTVITYLNEAHPLQSVPHTIVSYLYHRASHTTTCPMSQTHQIFSGSDIARAFSIISHGQVRARFFPVQSRDLQNSGNLCRIITMWLNRGVIPIITYSQATVDSSRHEVIFGANSSGVYSMSDPNHLQEEQALRQRLAEQGTTSVSHAEVLSRYSRDQNLQSLLHTTCLPWVTNNILGTIVGILRAKSFNNLSPSPTSPSSSHQQHHHNPLTFTLPLLCVSGIALVYSSSSHHCSTIETMKNAALSD